MKLGNVSQTVYRRSILKQLDKGTEVSVFPASQAEMCWGIQTEPGESLIACDVSLYGNEKDIGVFAMAQAVNHLAGKGAARFGVSMQILLPEFAYESRLKAMMAAVREAADKEQIQVLKAEAQSVPGIQTTIVHMTALGVVPAGQKILENNAPPEQDIVLLKWIGLEGMLRIKREKEEALAERFIPAFLDKIEALYEELFSVHAIAYAVATGASAIYQITDGGILAALWNLAETSDIGLSVDMKKIAVRQETIEVCEHFHLNPYQLTSAGCVLVVTPDGEGLIEAMQKKGIQAAAIGHTRKGKERVLTNGGEKRYLDRPVPDELVQIWNR